MLLDGCQQADVVHARSTAYLECITQTFFLDAAGLKNVIVTVAVFHADGTERLLDVVVFGDVGRFCEYGMKMSGGY